MNIKGLKLVTGEDVVAGISITQEGRFLLKNPVQVRLVPPKIPGGQPNMGFMPFPMFGTQNEGSYVIIEPLHMVYMYDLQEDIKSQYNQAFGTGIITPPNKQIIIG